ncbi:hypothetical protein [Bacillus thuringiensis]|nr:hypothetical protein [Bacillus thuringiensis]
MEEDNIYITAYHAPICTGKVDHHTTVWMKGYSINNPMMGTDFYK